MSNRSVDCMGWCILFGTFGQPAAESIQMFHNTRLLKFSHLVNSIVLYQKLNAYIERINPSSAVLDPKHGKADMQKFFKHIIRTNTQRLFKTI